MNKINRILFIALIAIITSCCDSESESYDFFEILESTPLLMDHIEGDFKFISLDDSHQESIIPDVWNIKFSEEYIFVLSAKEGVFQFEKGGRFIRKISQKGNGPREWSAIIDIAVDEIRKNIYIYDYSGKIMIYSYINGEYQEQLEIPGKIFSKMHIAGNYLIIAPYNAMGEEEVMMYCVNMNNFAIKSVGSLPKFSLYDYSHMLYSFTKGIIADANNVLLHPNLSNTIFEYSPEHNLLTEKLTIVLRDTLTPALRGLGYDGLKKSQTIMDIAQNKQYFFLKLCNYSSTGEWYALDNNDDRLYKLSLQYAPEIELYFSPKYQLNGAVADLIYTGNLNEKSSELTYISEKVGKEITPESNPIVVIWYEE